MGHDYEAMTNIFDLLIQLCKKPRYTIKLMLMGEQKLKKAFTFVIYLASKKFSGRELSEKNASTNVPTPK